MNTNKTGKISIVLSDCTHVNIPVVILHCSFAKRYQRGNWAMDTMLFPPTACISTIISENSHLKMWGKSSHSLNFKKKTKSYTKHFPKFAMRMAPIHFGAFRSGLRFSRK